MSLKVYLVVSMVTRPGMAKMSIHIVPVISGGGEQSSVMVSILFSLFYTVGFKSTNTYQQTGITVHLVLGGISQVNRLQMS